ncbi:PA2817 family protein [Pseudomaricurvus sp. HS19]|uniref:PA2817 family protein n=1 Tax=Pseudomaricurvus sp. HS19 TaxID=2692626 RepID=UPI001928F5EA|nr:PA2817 family protein [Pseudomaricurvus sp. HS19]
MSKTFFQFQQLLLQGLLDAASQQLPEEHRSEDDQALIDTLATLAQSESQSEEFRSSGQWAITRIVSAYPALTPQLPRDLFWLFGGECLHYMPDDEIERFQQLDERRFAAGDDNTEFDYEKERAAILGLH